MSDHIQQAADVIERSLDEMAPYVWPVNVAAALAAAGRLKAPDDEIVTPEQRAVLAAADKWRENDFGNTSQTLLAAVDALRAAPPKDDS
jgi:hypothetical protein